MLIGFNTSDAYAVGRQFMKDNGFNFRSVLDSSDEAIAFKWNKLKAGCVPLHYILDQKGRIAFVQAGFEKSFTQIKNTLDRLAGQ